MREGKGREKEAKKIPHKQAIDFYIAATSLKVQ